MSDLATATARREGDHYVVNGSKTFITGGLNADLFVTAVKTDPTQRHAGLSLLDRALTEHAVGELTSADAAKVKLFCTEMQGRGRHLPSSFPIHRCAMHGYPGFVGRHPTPPVPPSSHLAMHAPRSRSLIHAPTVGRSWSD